VTSGNTTTPVNVSNIRSPSPNKTVAPVVGAASSVSVAVAVVVALISALLA
jgi:CDP-diglyceride synthetase